MKNYGLGRVKVANVDNFTTKTGMKIRRVINKPLRAIFKMATKRKIIVESFAELEKGVPYIFASTHSFDEDVIAGLAVIDRSAYLLAGTTDQIDHNPQMYMAWLNGMIYVDRLNPQSRKDSVLKMEKVINNGSSVLMFPEGGWNNTENLLCQPLFAGPYIVAQKTGAKVVPVSSYNEPNSDKIYIKVGSPMDFSKKTKKEALTELRDNLSTMIFESMEAHCTPIRREELVGDIHLKYMDERKNEYMRVKWTRDVWDEELAFYNSPDITRAEDVRKSLDNVVVNKDNARILGPTLVKRLEDDKYNFKNYMKQNWNK